jgi:ornithine cyclodeaminase/alanine dehydrogenase-like protein (mu-crystallin family)
MLGAEAVAAALSCAEAADALEAALAGGLDPETDPPRTALPAGPGELLVMPSAAAGSPTVKLVTVGGEPRIQGVCVVFDPHTLAPRAILDAGALTVLRTAAVSALAVRRLAGRSPRRLLVFGAGPQGRAHAAAIPALLPTIETVTIAGRGEAAPVEAADVICCCTTSRQPLFAGERVGAETVVIAIGAHQADATELDPALVRRADVFVESRTSALREAGEVILAGLGPERIVPLAARWRPTPGRPRVFTSTGMAWQDAVVATAVAERAPVPPVPTTPQPPVPHDP